MVYVDGWPWSFYIKELAGRELFIKTQKWFGDGKNSSVWQWIIIVDLSAILPRQV